ncbi:hypothetical protein [Frankia sp. KB5]|uniref:hypothetical protein n=1 Tax=Frankia sp. KB5 TaxID=683318 RepID=UPI0032203DBA
MAESDVLFAVVLFAAAGQRAVDRIIAPFPDRGSAVAFARDNGLHCFSIGPMAFAVPTTVPPPASTVSAVVSPAGNNRGGQVRA